MMATPIASTEATVPLISVIVPHLNQPIGLNSCLDSLNAQTLGRSQFEIIVVDNGSISVPEAIIARHPGTRLLRETRPGPGLARNAGVQAAAGKILCFIDADCRADPDWLRVALGTIDCSPEGTILGGDVRIWRDGRKTFTAMEAYESVFAYMQKSYIERHGFSGTGNLVVRRGDFNRIGPFEGIHVAEDMDWGWRARAAGFQFRYVAAMIIYHPARGALRHLFVKLDRHTQHYLNMARQKPHWQVRWVARALAVLISPAVAIVNVVTTDRIQGISARLKAASVLVAVRSYRAWKMLSLMHSSKEVVWNRNAGTVPDE